MADELELLYINEPDILPLAIKRGANWYLAISDIDDQTGLPIDRSGWTGKMRMRVQSTGASVSVTPTFTLTDGPNGEYRFDITYADTETLPLSTLEYDIFIRKDPDSICIYEGTVAVYDNISPIP